MEEEEKMAAGDTNIKMCCFMATLNSVHHIMCLDMFVSDLTER